MNKTKVVLVTMVLFFILGLNSCSKSDFPHCDDDDLKLPNCIQEKSVRVELGDLIMESIQSQSDNFPILPNVEPHDVAYDYLQSAYNQVSTFLKHDGLQNSWDTTRIWKLNILDDDINKKAFVIPGGNLFLSTGLLKSLESGKEIYFILAFEACLMNDEYLINRLIEEFNTNEIFALSNGMTGPSGTTIEDLVDILDKLEFTEESVVREVDRRAMEEICQSSNVVPNGINNVLLRLEEEDNWLKYRPSYEYRDNPTFIDSEILDLECYNTDNQVEQYFINVIQVLDP